MGKKTDKKALYKSILSPMRQRFDLMYYVSTVFWVHRGPCYKQNKILDETNFVYKTAS